MNIDRDLMTIFGKMWTKKDMIGFFIEFQINIHYFFPVLLSYQINICKIKTSCTHVCLIHINGKWGFRYSLLWINTFSSKLETYQLLLLWLRNIYGWWSKKIVRARSGQQHHWNSTFQMQTWNSTTSWCPIGVWSLLGEGESVLLMMWPPDRWTAHTRANPAPQMFWATPTRKSIGKGKKRRLWNEMEKWKEVGEGDEVGGGTGEREEENSMWLSSPHHLRMSIGYTFQLQHTKRGNSVTGWIWSRKHWPSLLNMNNIIMVSYAARMSSWQEMKLKTGKKKHWRQVMPIAWKSFAKAKELYASWFF